MKQYIQRYDQYLKSVKESTELGFEAVESAPSNEIPLEDKLKLNSDELAQLRTELPDEETEEEIKKEIEEKYK